MTNKIIPIAVILVIVVIVAALALTQTNQNTAVASSNDSMNMGSNGSAGTSEATVIIENGTFNPANLTVKAGTIVKWTVNDNSNIKYMVTSDANGSVEGKYLFMSNDLTNGQSFSYTFNKTGTYGYYDMNHMDNKSLVGTIIVQ